MIRAFGGMDQALDYALQQLPGNHAKELLEGLKEASALCAEAARLSVDSRGVTGCRFEPTVIDCSPVPALVIRATIPNQALNLGMRAEEQFARFESQGHVYASGQHAFGQRGLGQNFVADMQEPAFAQPRPAVAPCFWSLHETRERVQQMRGYEKPSLEQSNGAGVTSRTSALVPQHLLDPWQKDIPFAEVSQRVAQLELALAEAKLSRAKLFAKTLAMWQNKRDRACLGHVIRQWAGPGSLSADGASTGVARRSGKVVAAKAQANPPATTTTSASVAATRASSTGGRPRSTQRGARSRTATPSATRCASPGPASGSGAKLNETESGTAIRHPTPRVRSPQPTEGNRAAPSQAQWKSGKNGSASWSASAAPSSRSKPSPKVGTRTITNTRMRDTPPRTPSPASRSGVSRSGLRAAKAIDAERPASPGLDPITQPEARAPSPDHIVQPEPCAPLPSPDRITESEGWGTDDMFAGDRFSPSFSIPGQADESARLSEVIDAANDDYQGDWGELRLLRTQLREMCSSLRLRCANEEVLSSPSRLALLETLSGQLSDFSGSGATASREKLVTSSPVITTTTISQPVASPILSQSFTMGNATSPIPMMSASIGSTLSAPVGNTTVGGYPGAAALLPSVGATSGTAPGNLVCAGSGRFAMNSATVRTNGATVAPASVASSASFPGSVANPAILRATGLPIGSPSWTGGPSASGAPTSWVSHA